MLGSRVRAPGGVHGKRGFRNNENPLFRFGAFYGTKRKRGAAKTAPRFGLFIYPQNILSGLTVLCGTQPAGARQGRASAAGGCGPRGSFRAAISTESSMIIVLLRIAVKLKKSRQGLQAVLPDDSTHRQNNSQMSRQDISFSKL